MIGVKPLTGKSLSSFQASTASTATYNCWEGSVRASKTVSSILAWIKFVRTAPPGDLLMVGKTERTLKRNIIDPILSMIGNKRARYVIGSGEFFIGSRRILVVGANDERAQDRIRGMTLVGAYVDEVTILPESFFKMLGTRLSVAGAKLFCTTNPDNPGHWFKKSYLDRAEMIIGADGRTTFTDPDDEPLDLNRFSFILDDNPHLNPDFVARLKREYTGLWYKRYILGLWVVAEGAVYDMFDPVRHVVTDLPPVARWIADGIDYGTTNPTRGVRIGVTAEPTPRLIAAAEWAPPTGLVDAAQSRGYRTWAATAPGGVDPGMWVCVDPAAASFKVQLRSDDVNNVINGANEVVPGIRTLASLLATDRLVIHASCAQLIRHLPGYSWDPKATAKGEDTVLKQDDHEADALRYAVHTTRNLWRDDIDLTIPDPEDIAA